MLLMALLMMLLLLLSIRCVGGFFSNRLPLRMTTTVSALETESTKVLLRREMASPVPSKLRIYGLIDRLCEEKREEGESGAFLGTWILLWTDDDKTRASPFFWAFRKAFGETEVPAGNLADSVFKITDAIPSSLKQIGSVRQYVQASGKLVSQIEIVSPIGSSFMTTTSRWSEIGGRDGEGGLGGGGEVELRVEKTQVLGSTLQRMLNIPSSSPLVAQGFPSGAALELASPGSSTVGLTNLYIDDMLRVSKNDFDKVFVFERAVGVLQPVG